MPITHFLSEFGKYLRHKNKVKQVNFQCTITLCIFMKSLQILIDSLKLILCPKIKNPISKWDILGMVEFSYFNIIKYSQFNLFDSWFYIKNCYPIFEKLSPCIPMVSSIWHTQNCKHE